LEPNNDVPPSEKSSEVANKLLREALMNKHKDIVAPKQDKSKHQKKTAFVGFKTYPDTKTMLEKYAKKDRRTLSQYVEIVLMEHIEKIEKSKS
jgi:hypothetical protein